MNVVDSSAWLEYFRGGPNSEFFSEAIEKPELLLVPSIVLFEVFKRLLQEAGTENARRGVGFMRSGTIVDLDADVALRGARLSITHRLAMADSIILATAQKRNATLWTQDADFEAMPGVQYRKHTNQKR